MYHYLTHDHWRPGGEIWRSWEKTSGPQHRRLTWLFKPRNVGPSVTGTFTWHTGDRGPCQQRVSGDTTTVAVQLTSLSQWSKPWATSPSNQEIVAGECEKMFLEILQVKVRLLTYLWKIKIWKKYTGFKNIIWFERLSRRSSRAYWGQVWLGKAEWNLKPLAGVLSWYDSGYDPVTSHTGDQQTSGPLGALNTVILSPHNKSDRRTPTQSFSSDWTIILGPRLEIFISFIIGNFPMKQVPKCSNICRIRLNLFVQLVNMQRTLWLCWVCVEKKWLDIKCFWRLILTSSKAKVNTTVDLTVDLLEPVCRCRLLTKSPGVFPIVKSISESVWANFILLSQESRVGQQIGSVWKIFSRVWITQRTSDNGTVTINNTTSDCITEFAHFRQNLQQFCKHWPWNVWLIMI